MPVVIDREAIFAALFAAVSNATPVTGPSFVTMSRRLKHWADVPPSEQPAIFQTQRMEIVQVRTGLPPKHIPTAKLYIYANSSDPNVAPSTLLNPLMDAVEAALFPDRLGRNVMTLGGLAYRAAIDGRIETDEGTLGDQAVAIMPITILVP